MNVLHLHDNSVYLWKKKTDKIFQERTARGLVSLKQIPPRKKSTDKFSSVRTQKYSLQSRRSVNVGTPSEARSRAVNPKADPRRNERCDAT